MESFGSAKEEIRQAADIVEVVGQFVQLRKAGQNYLGLCPFHSEKAPSFTVSPSKQMFHCFGCKKGGDVFAFWMAYHNVSFAQALRDLADRYHISLPEPTRTPGEKRRLELRESLFKLNELAVDFYCRVLPDSRAGDPGKAYFRQRGIHTETISDFKLGYAPDRWDALSRFLENRQVDMDHAVQAGLVIARKQGGWYDRFRGRVVFPIFTATQRIAGFGARVLDDALPKYLNTPETPIFRKGELLYGLHAGGTAIRQNRRAVVVEGYTDVLALHQSGFPEAVATLGTALTREHVRKLKGYAEEVVVVFDSDEAGRTAALKSLPFFLTEGLECRTLILPEGEDPDSYVNRYGLDRFLEQLEGAKPVFDHYIDTSLSNAGDGIEAKASALRDILSALAGLEDKARMSLYVQRLADRTGIPEAVILKELTQVAQRHGRAPEMRTPLEEDKPGLDERHLLNLLVHHPEAAGDLLNCKDWEVLLPHPAARTVFGVARELLSARGCIVPAEIAERLEGDDVGALFREILVSPNIYPEDTVDQAVEEFKNRIQERAVETIAEQERRGDLERANALLQRKRERLNRSIQ
ncbi:MAG: DNA primase [Desulfobacteraceae bacterium]|jgi:DNA primase